MGWCCSLDTGPEEFKAFSKKKKKKKKSCISIVEGDLRDIFQFGKLYPKEEP